MRTYSRKNKKCTEKFFSVRTLVCKKKFFSSPTRKIFYKKEKRNLLSSLTRKIFYKKEKRNLLSSLTRKIFYKKEKRNLLSEKEKVKSINEKLSEEKEKVKSINEKLSEEKEKVKSINEKLSEEKSINENLIEEKSINEKLSEGKVWIMFCGDYKEHTLEEGEILIADEDNVVAFEEKVNQSITSVGGLLTITTGNKFVVKFTGPGKVYTQSCSLRDMAYTLQKYLPKPQVEVVNSDGLISSITDGASFVQSQCVVS
jgi:hypothetical protein